MSEVQLGSENIETNDAIETNDIKGTEPTWKWFVSLAFLAFCGISSGTPNLYQTFSQEIQAMLGISRKTALFMMTGGFILLFITLPAGLFMDRFGSTLTFWISTCTTIVSYVLMILSKKVAGLFITFYLIGAFGSASLFVCCLQIGLSRSPANIKGISVSIISASLSLSVGLWNLVYQAGSNLFKCTDNCVLQKMSTVVISISVIILVSSIVAWYFFRIFPQDTTPPNSNSKMPLYLLKDWKIYLFALLMLITVFDGQIVLAGGTKIWTLYGDESGSYTFLTPFSVTNCVSTILISILMDALMNSFQLKRANLYSYFWIGFIIIHFLFIIMFLASSSRIGFGIVTSMMGIPFGFGLTHIPALTSDLFGNDVYGFAFGIIQLGAIISACMANPLFDDLQKTGITVVLVITIIAHIITGVLLLFSARKKARYTSEHSSGSDELIVH